jgi:hypothetical protein
MQKEWRCHLTQATEATTMDVGPEIMTIVYERMSGEAKRTGQALEATFRPTISPPQGAL